MSEMDEVERRLEARVGKRFVEVLREFAAAEIRRRAAAPGHGELPPKRPKRGRSTVVALPVVSR